MLRSKSEIRAYVQWHQATAQQTHQRAVDFELAEQPEPAAERAAEGPLEMQYPTLYPLLEEQGRDVERAALSFVLDIALASPRPLPEYRVFGLTSALNDLLPELRRAIGTSCPGLPWEVAQQIGDALELSGHVDDGALVGGFLFHAGRLA